MARERTNLIRITEPITLDDLRWLVEQCAGMKGQTTVAVTGRREHGPMDYDPAVISINKSGHER